MELVKKATTDLRPGDVVDTTEPEGTDFGIPLVEPARGKRPARVARQVRNVVRTGRGQVVWFADSTKSRPVHGRTAWEAWDE